MNPLRRTLVCGAALTATAALLTGAPSAAAQPHPHAPRTERVSTAADGTEGNGQSASPSPSADGRYVAFDSEASNLVPGDTNDRGDAFVRDLRTGTVVRAGVGDDGRQADGSWSVVLSPDGRYAAFTSFDPGLAPGERPDKGSHLYIRDLRERRTEAVDLGPRGSSLLHRPHAFSADGRHLAYSMALPSDGGPPQQASALYLYDRERHRTEVISQPLEERPGEPAVGSASLSADGRYVSFQAYPPRISTRSSVYVRDRRTGELRTVDHTPGDPRPVSQWYGEPSLSADGRFIAYVTHRDGGRPNPGTHWEVFVHDLRTGRTVLASAAPDGGPLDEAARQARLSPDGRYVVYGTKACATGEPQCRYALYLRDLRRTGTDATRRVSASLDGGFPERADEEPVPSRGGRTVVFQSYAPDLVPGDTNGATDVFVRHLR